MDHQFQLPGSYKKWTYGLIAVGLVALLYGCGNVRRPVSYMAYGPCVDGIFCIALP